MGRNRTWHLLLLFSPVLGAGCSVPPDDPDPPVPFCGDGILDQDEGEECDDGNTDPGDGCSPACEIAAVCGDGVLDEGEECDDGNSDPSDACTHLCTVARCGDEAFRPETEVCDAGDGCSATCTPEPVRQATGYCALLFDGRVKCWGAGMWGALGYESTETLGDEPGEMGAALPVVDLGTGELAVQLASGFAHNCALLESGKIKCWGANGRGSCGVGKGSNIGQEPGQMGDDLPYADMGTGKTALSIALGRAHSCAVLNDHSVKCWGMNVVGQLGQGDKDDRGDNPGEMGDALPPIDLGTGRTAQQVAAGDEFTCALLDDNTVKCWGLNYDGELGLGDKLVRGDQPGEMGDALPPVDLGTDLKILSIAAGEHSTCVILEDGSVRCWGGNDCGEAGNPNGGIIGDEPEDMGDGLLPLYMGKGKKAVQLSMGDGAACALLDDGTVNCWGCGSHGQLAGAVMEPDTGFRVLPLGQGVQSVYIGYPRGCAVLDDGKLKCWGSNAVGQLGQGDTMSRPASPDLPIVHVYDDRW